MRASRRFFGIPALLAALAGMAVGGAQAATDLTLTIVNDSEPVVGAQIEIFLSNDYQLAATDDLGQVTFEVESGRGFWLEVDGERLAEFYFVDDAPESIDLATTDTIEWGR